MISEKNSPKYFGFKLVLNEVFKKTSETQQRQLRRPSGNIGILVCLLFTNRSAKNTLLILSSAAGSTESAFKRIITTNIRNNRAGVKRSEFHHRWDHLEEETVHMCPPEYTCFNASMIHVHKNRLLIKKSRESCKEMFQGYTILTLPPPKAYKCLGASRY